MAVSSTASAPSPRGRRRRRRGKSETHRARAGWARAGWARALRAVHRVLGLGFAASVVLASLTGGLLVMHRELERVVEPDRHVLAGSALLPPRSAVDQGSRRPMGSARSKGPAAAIAPIVQAVAAQAPAGYRPLRLMLAREPGETEKLIFVGADGRTRWTAILNPHTGEVLWRGADQSLFTSWLLGLHMHLRLGGWGYLVTGVAGVGLFVLGVSGLFVYRGRLRALWRRPVRLGRGWRPALGDLHQWLGVVSIYFSLVLGLTGAIYAFKIASGQIAAPTLPAPAFDPARLAPIEPALALARERFPKAELLRVAFPSSTTAPLTVLVLHRDAPVWRKFSRIEFDPAAGSVRKIHDARDATVREKISAMLAPLHFGFHGSRVVKWLYVIGGFSPALLALSGTAMWLLRRRKRAAADTPVAAATALGSLGATRSRATLTGL